MFFVGLALMMATVQQRTDTLVVRGRGDIPATATRGLVAEWKTGEQVEIGDITDIAIAPDGRVYLWDIQTPAVWQLSADGKQIKQVGRKGAGPGEYDGVNGITVRPDGKLISWDAGNTRVNVYGPDGQSQGTWRLFSEGRLFIGGGALTATVDNRVFMKTSIRRRNERDAEAAVVTFDQSGVPRDTTFVQMFPGDAPLVARRPEGNGSSSRYLPYGTSTKYALSPLGHIVSGPGRPYVVHTMYKGRPLRIERQYTPVPVSRDERDKLRAQVEARMRNTQPNWTWTGSDVPETKPAYENFMIGADGRIWVQLSVESEKYEPEMPSTPRPNPFPVVPYRAKEQRWDIFEPDGRFVARVVAPRLFRAFAARGDSVWGMTRDQDDVPTVVKMRIAPAR